MCDILLKCFLLILKAHDISFWKIQEKVEIITNHILQFWTKIPKNGYCDMLPNYTSLEIQNNLAIKTEKTLYSIKLMGMTFFTKK